MARYGIKKKKQGYGPDLAQSGPGYGSVPGQGSVGASRLFSVTQPSVAPFTPRDTPYTPPSSDSTLEAENAAIDRWAASRQQGYQSQAADLRREYGFTDNGAFGYGGVDTSNPFSKAMLLKESFDRAQRGYQNSYAARGLGYSGAAQRMQDYAANEYNKGYNTLTTGLGRSLNQLSSAYGETASEAAMKRAEAQRAFSEREIANRPAPPDLAPPGPAYQGWWKGAGTYGPGGVPMAPNTSLAPGYAIEYDEYGRGRIVKVGR